MASQRQRSQVWIRYRKVPMVRQQVSVIRKFTFKRISIFWGYQEIDSKLYMKKQNIQISYPNAEGEEQGTGGLTLPDFQAYWSTVSQRLWYWWKNKWLDQWKGAKNPEMGSHTNTAIWCLTREQRQWYNVGEVFSTTGRPQAKQTDQKTKQNKTKKPIWTWTLHKLEIKK